MMTVALVAAIGVSAIVTSVAQPTQAKTDQCHNNGPSGSTGCNPGSTFGGFNNNNGNFHFLPNGPK
jgi:uncharacterized membrane protein